MNQPDFEQAMRTLAAQAVSPVPLPDVDLIWQRAAVRERRRQAELVLRPVRLAEWLACVVCAAAGVALLLTLDPAVLRLAGMAFSIAAGVALALVRTLTADE